MPSLGPTVLVQDTSIYLFGVWPPLATSGTLLWPRPLSSHPWRAVRFHLVPSLIPVLLPCPSQSFFPPAWWNTLLKKKKPRSNPIFPCGNASVASTDGVPAPFLDLKAKSAHQWSPKHHLPLTHTMLCYTRLLLFPWIDQALSHPGTLSKAFCFEKGCPLTTASSFKSQLDHHSAESLPPNTPSGVFPVAASRS